MNTINFDLMQSINLIENKSTSKENKNNLIENKKLDDVNSFENYLNKSKNELKKEDKLERKVENKSDEKIDDKSKETITDDLKNVVEKIEDTLDATNDLEETNLSENISEIILLLLKAFSKTNDSNEVDSSNLENIESNINFAELDSKSSLILENLMLDSDSIDNSKVISKLNDIKGSIDEILANIELEDLESEFSLDDTLINKINELLTEVVDKDLINEDVNLKLDKSIDIKENENLDIKQIISYLENNIVEDEKETNSLDIKSFRDLSSFNIKEDTINLENKNTNSNSEFNSESLETSKEDDFLSKLLSEESADTSFNNYYDRVFNNKLQSNQEIITAPVNINKATMNVDIIKNIKYMIADSIEELSVKIYPKELGEVTIKILSEEGIMRAEIKATSKETYNLINSNLNEIKKSLENQNIKIQEVNIGIYNEDTTFFSGKEGQNHNERNFNEDINPSYIYEEEEVIEEISSNNNVNYLA